MAKYDASALEGKADFLYVRAVFSVIFHGAVFALGFSMLHTILGLFETVIEFVSLHHMTYPALHNPQAVTDGMFIWFLVGAGIGLGKAMKYAAEAQAIMCSVEQEKHLRVIATYFANKKE